MIAHTDVSAQFSEGQSLGYGYAEADRKAHACYAAEEAELRAQAQEARDTSPSWRAFKLGIVRAYRDATRTADKRGRWGL